MIVCNGEFRKVLVFNKYVIKFPKSFRGLLVNIHEGYMYLRYKKYGCLLPPKVILFIINIFPRGDPLEDFEWNETNEYFKLLYYNIDPLMNDLKQDNFCKIGNNIYKSDYGYDFWFDNTFIKLHNKLVTIKSRFIK